MFYPVLDFSHVGCGYSALSVFTTVLMSRFLAAQSINIQLKAMLTSIDDYRHACELDYN